MANKKAQMMELPFQLIFSIILIAVFLYAAIVGIRYFMERGEQMQVGQFLSDLKSDVNLVWQATEKSNDYSFNLPAKVQKVCFADLNSVYYNRTVCPDFEFYKEAAKAQGSNVFFCPPESVYKTGAPVFYKIDCDGIDCLKFSKQPYCIQNVKGSFKVHLEKKLGNPNVMLS